jgi:serine/threonine protein kinase
MLRAWGEQCWPHWTYNVAMTGSDTDIDALVGTTVGGKYQIDAVLGRGGMGAVFRATNRAIGKRVALKFLYRDAARDLDAVARFQREAEAASAVESAHIVQIFDSGSTDEGLPFLVMELLRGEDLRTRLKREGRLPVSEVIRIAGQVARGLRGAHEAGIVHRDLKPDNIYLCERDDDPMFVKIVDFGISKIARRSPTADTLTHQGVVLGTAFYMSPEQARAERDIDGRTDLFSLGAIMYEALAGRPPHVGTAYEAVLIDICTCDAPDVRQFAPEVPEAVAQLLAKALARDRDQRFANAQQLYDALAETAPGLLKPSLPSGSGPRLLGPAASPPAAQTPGRAPAADPEGATEPASDYGSVPTTEGTAVGASARDGSSLRVRHAVVVGVIATITAFSLTVGFLSRSRSSPVGDEAAEPHSAGEAVEARPAPGDGVGQEGPQQAPGARQPAADTSSASLEAAQPSAAVPDRTQPVPGRTDQGPRGTARPRSAAAKRHKPAGKRGRSSSDATGVAKGLQLVTEP